MIHRTTLFGLNTNQQAVLCRLLYEGEKLFKNKEYKEALDHYSKANDIIDLPSISLLMILCLVGMKDEIGATISIKNMIQRAQDETLSKSIINICRYIFAKLHIYPKTTQDWIYTLEKEIHHIVHILNNGIAMYIYEDTTDPNEIQLSETLCAENDALFNNGKYQEAINKCNQALELDNNPLIHIYKGLYHLAQNETEDAWIEINLGIHNQQLQQFTSILLICENVKNATRQNNPYINKKCAISAKENLDRIVYDEYEELPF